MSEYQYYEFRALDRPLTQDQMDALRSLSSRAQITPGSFINVYNYGDFRGDPRELMEKYFDAFLYVANWGTHQLMFRVPKRLLGPESASPYCCDDILQCWSTGDRVILFFEWQDEAPDWVDGEDWLPSIVPIRADLMKGDLRCLYLGWLLAAQEAHLDDEETEPPVPPGLGELTASLKSFAEFFELDPDLITAAAEGTAAGPTHQVSKADIAKWVAGLPLKEKNAVLTTIIEGDDPHIGAELRQRALSEILGAIKETGPSRSSQGRTVAELMARAEIIAEERKKAEAKEQAREKAKRVREEAAARKKYLESLTGRESDLWAKIDERIAKKHHVAYNEAVSLLEDLRDLAVINSTEPEFSQRMNDLAREHETKTGLMKRFRTAKLLK